MSRVTLFQLRLTRRMAGVPAALKWVVAMLLMGLPFLFLSVTSALPAIVAILVVFVVGEMLWVPTSQSLAARMAPEDLRGAYMGAFGGTAAIGFALSPFLGLQVRSAGGDSEMWAAFALVAVISAVLGAITCLHVAARNPAPAATDVRGSAA
jgi:MFS family permease